MLHTQRNPLQRLWQPGRAAFWMMLAFNGLSSGLAWTVHLADPVGWLRWLLAGLALANMVMGAWMLSILWRESASHTQGENDVQGTADQQVR